MAAKGTYIVVGFAVEEQDRRLDLVGKREKAQLEIDVGRLPMQSDRFYDALKGEGATVRFVLLPLEAHAYQGRENVLHMLWEMETWLDKYVKPAQPVVANR